MAETVAQRTSWRFEPVWWLARVICYPLRLLFRCPHAGWDHVPRHGPVLLASNHISFIDPISVLWLGERRRRKVRFLAKAELWKVRVLRFFLTHTYQIPVPRDTMGAGASLVHAAKALQDGECVCVFPEGTISRDLEPMPGKTGAARLAAMSGVPVTPVGLWGCHRIYPIGRKFRPRLGVAGVIVVGDAVHIDAGEDVFEATDRIMTAIAACVATARRIYPQRPRRGEGDWWVRRPETAVMRPTPRERHSDRWS